MFVTFVEFVMYFLQMNKDIWQTRQIKSLFNLKDKNTHRSHEVYEGYCSCGVDYIGETKRNAEVQIDEHSNLSNDSETARHLRENPTHSSAQSFHKRRIIEGLII